MRGNEAFTEKNYLRPNDFPQTQLPALRWPINPNPNSEPSSGLAGHQMCET